VCARRYDADHLPKVPGGFSIQPRRRMVEMSFAWSIRNRRIAKDYERQAQTSETLIEIAVARLVLRRLAEHRKRTVECPALLFYASCMFQIV
jgi:hypothetical protein